jgi:hypothetical protein
MGAMNDFNFTIQLAQAELDDLKNRLAAAPLPASKPLARRDGLKAVGRLPYNRRKYRTASASEVDRIVNREVF